MPNTIISANIKAKPDLLKNKPKIWNNIAISQKKPFTMSGKKNKRTKFKLNIVFKTAINAQIIKIPEIINIVIIVLHFVS